MDIGRVGKWMAAVTVLAILAGCGSKPIGEPVTKSSASAPAAVTSPSPTKVKITLATATEGGVFWPMGREIAAIWNEKVPGVEVDAIKTGGTADNIQKLGFGDVQIGLAVSGVVYYAVNGIEDYKAQGKQQELRGLVALHPNVIHLLVNKDAGITSLKDLKKRAWAPGAERSATEINTREMLHVVGVEPLSMKNYYAPYDKSVELMKNKTVDGATLAAGVGGKAVKDAVVMGDWQVLNLPKAEVEAIVQKYPSYFPFTLPAGTYEGQTEPVRTVAQSSILVARADLPTDLVYQLVKAFYEGLGTLGEKVSAATVITLENGLKGIDGVVPLHPGAEKYFREKGIIK